MIFTLLVRDGRHLKGYGLVVKRIFKNIRILVIIGDGRVSGAGLGQQGLVCVKD